MRALVMSVSVILCVSSFNALAANRHVRAGGTGSQDGSNWANAYPALPTNLVRGDVYYIAEGTYSGRTFNTAASGTTTITIKKATASDHGSDTGWDNSLGDGQVVFNGGFEFLSPYWIVDGQTGGGAENSWSQNFGMKIIERDDGDAVISLGNPNQSAVANNIQIRHVDLEGKGSVSTQGGSFSNDGLAVYGSTNVLLSHFRMKGIGRGPFFLSGRDVVVEHGWVESFFGSSAVHSEVASIWSFSGRVGDTTFRYNLFTDIQSTGGIMWDNSANTSARLFVYGNVFYKPPGARWNEANGLIGGWTGGNGEEFRNASVYNNSFINVDQSSLSTLPNIASNNSAHNNIFYNCDPPKFSKFSSHDNNLFINSGGTQSEPNGATATGDPFVNIAGLDFRLKAATAAGAMLPAPMNVDPYGQTRGADGIFDRGAFEFASGGPVPSAPTALTVN